MSDEKLTRDDLVLLMESYRNMITMHQTILSQTNKTIDKLDIIANKQDSLFSEQGRICSDLNKITDKLEGALDHCKESTKKVEDLSTSITDKINEHDKKSIEDHGKMTNKIQFGWIGMGTIILGIIGLMITVVTSMPIPPVLP